MNIEMIVVASIGALQAIIVAFFGFLHTRESRKHKEAMEKSEERAAKAEYMASQRIIEGKLAMRLLQASVTLGTAIAIAIRDGRANGSIDYALVDAAEARDAYQVFIEDFTVRNIASEKK